mgnify:CR=1 FL=1
MLGVGLVRGAAGVPLAAPVAVRRDATGGAQQPATHFGAVRGRPGPGRDRLELTAYDDARVLLLGGEPFRHLFTNTAVLIGLVYGFMPFMVLPLYAALERMDWRLVEAARDLYADGWTAFRKVTLPLSMPGVVAGSILVFIPSLGAYVTPALLGGAKTVLMGDYIVSQFLAARNWPFGSALSFAVMFVMLLATIFYFRAGAKTL